MNNAVQTGKENVNTHKLLTDDFDYDFDLFMEQDIFDEIDDSKSDSVARTRNPNGENPTQANYSRLLSLDHKNQAIDGTTHTVFEDIYSEILFVDHLHKESLANMTPKMLVLFKAYFAGDRKQQIQEKLSRQILFEFLDIYTRKYPATTMDSFMDTNE